MLSHIKLPHYLQVCWRDKQGAVTETVTVKEIPFRTYFFTYDDGNDNLGRIGETFEVIGLVNEPDDENDPKVLPYFRIKFADGHEINAWPQEIALID